MSYCGRGNKKTKTAYTTPAKKTVNPPAPRTETCETSSSNIITGGGSSSSNTVYVPGPAGPAGPGFYWEGQWTIGVQYYAQDTAPAPREKQASVVYHNGSSWIATSDNISESTSSPEHEPGVSSSWSLVAQHGDNGLGFKWEGQFALNVQYYAQDTAPSPREKQASVVEYLGSTYIAVTDNISVTEENPEYEPGVSSAWALIAQKGEGTLAGEDKTFFDSLKDDIFDWYKKATLAEVLGAAAIAAGVIWAGSKIIGAMTDDGGGDGEADQRFTGSDGYVVSSYTPPDIKDVIASICDACGVDYDVSALPDAPCAMAAGNTTSGMALLNELSLVFLFDILDSGGTLRFVPRSSTPVKTFSDLDIGFYGGDGPGANEPKFTVKRLQGITLPRSVTITYVADDTDYNPMTQTSQVFTFAAGQDINLSTSVVLTHEQAKKVAELSLMQSHIERTQYAWNTSYQHIELQVGDVITHPKMGAVKINSVIEDADGLLKFEGTDAGATAALESSTLEVAIPPASTNIPVSLGYSQAFWIDPPNVSNTDTNVRIKAAIHGYGRAGWPGAQIYVSENGGASYEAVGVSSNESTVGRVATAAATGDYYGWDETTTISVQLKTGALSSVSKTDVKNGKNWCMVGREILGFRNAVLTGPKTYTISGLLRGRQGTEQFVGTHEADELFVLLDSTIVDLTFDDVDRNKTFKFKVVTIGSSLDKVAPEDVQIVSNNKRLWTVHNAKAIKFGSDYQISYRERIRFNNALRDGSDIIHDDDWAGFGIAIMDGSTVKNTYTTTSEVFTYTSAMQTTDFGSPQSSITVQVVQLSKNGTPGYPVTLTA